jgi:hypothetical protein
VAFYCVLNSKYRQNRGVYFPVCTDIVEAIVNGAEPDGLSIAQIMKEVISKVRQNLTEKGLLKRWKW